MAEDVILQKIPEWVKQLQTGGPLPPEPYGGWGRWWDDWSGHIWFLLIVFGLQVTILLIEALTRRWSRGSAGVSPA
jgi:hypothetical protein